MITLDVVVPTHNRAELLEKAVNSLLAARTPAGLSRRIIIVDNNSTDTTAETISRMSAGNPGAVSGIHERQQGRSAALNAGIRASSAELIGFIDDDETVSEGWLEAVAAEFSRSEVDFIGGPVQGNWEVAAPAWLPAGLSGVLGIIEHGEDARDYGRDFPGILVGGNCVFRRSVFEKVGLYNTNLGRTTSGLRSGEDDDLYARLLRAGLRGRYVPSLRIQHFIPRYRVTKRYFRSWRFWHAVSRGIRLRTSREPTPYLAGIPRYDLGKALRSTGGMARGSSRERFASELELWSLAGLLYGRFVARLKKDDPRPA